MTKGVLAPARGTHYHVRVRAAVMLFLVAFLVAPGARAQPAGPSVVHGRVRSAGADDAGPFAVFLDGGPPAAPASATLDEVWISFVPKIQIVAPGSTLVLQNHDDESHSVHGHRGAATVFDRATVPHGEPQRVTLDRPGAVVITCDIHREMRGIVLVSRSRHHAITDREGRFRIEGVPPGRYRVRVFRDDGLARDEASGDEPGEALASLDVTGTDVSLDLDLPAPARAMTVAAAPTTPSAAMAPPPPPLPAWMRAFASRRGSWPRSTLLIDLLAALGVLAGMLAAMANYRLADAAGWTRMSALLLGCALAFVLGLLFLVGLHPAVAAALGFGVFTGTAIFGGDGGGDERAT